MYLLRTEQGKNSHEDIAVSSKSAMFKTLEAQYWQDVLKLDWKVTT